jgi:hypothetical protein
MAVCRLNFGIFALILAIKNPGFHRGKNRRDSKITGQGFKLTG